MSSQCEHLDTIEYTEGRDGAAGCEECLASGSTWVHLRRCTSCDHVGCCDSSPNRHATAHFRSSGHPVIRSIEPGEHWFWCYVDEIAFEIAP